MFNQYPLKFKFSHFQKTWIRNLYRSSFDLDFTSDGFLHRSIFKALDKFTVNSRQQIINFPCKIFKMRFLRSSECLKTISNSPEQPVELIQNVTTETKTHTTHAETKCKRN